jgi:hypothetical protein
MPASRKLDAVSQVRMTRAERAALDDWRRAQPDIPTRPEAIREAIRRLVADAPVKTRHHSPCPPAPNVESLDMLMTTARGRASPKGTAR